MEINNISNFSYNTKHRKTVQRSTVNFKGLSDNKSINKLAKSFDFKGYNLPLKAIIAYTFGIVLGARLIQSRDSNERREVATRDFSAIATIVFAVPILQKLVATASRKSLGVPLTYWPEIKVKRSIKDTLSGYLNPAGKYNLASSEDLSNWYTKIKDKKDGIVSFCKQHAENQGSLWKMFQFLDKDSKDALNKIASDSELKDKCVKEGNGLFRILTSPLRVKDSGTLNIPKDNEHIIKMLEKTEDKTSKNILENYLNKSSKDGNNLHKTVEFLKSIPDLINIGIVAGFLGYLLPTLNIAYTKSIYKKQAQPIQKEFDINKISNNIADKPANNLSNNLNINSDLFAKFQK